MQKIGKALQFSITLHLSITQSQRRGPSMKRLLSWVPATALVAGRAVATGPAAVADKADLAHGRPVVTSSNQATATAVTDGDQDTYWQSAKSHDQWAQVDL